MATTAGYVIHEYLLPVPIYLLCCINLPAFFTRLVNLAVLTEESKTLAPPIMPAGTKYIAAANTKPLLAPDAPTCTVSSKDNSLWSTTKLYALEKATSIAAHALAVDCAVFKPLNTNAAARVFPAGIGANNNTGVTT